MVLPGIGEPESLEARERDLGPVAAGRARLRMEATGVSFAERSMRRGKYYQQPAFPFVPGYDVVGTIEELGVGAPAGLAVGNRVAALTKIGGWARHVVLDAGDLVPVPAGVSAVAAETVIINGLTALRVLRRTRAVAGDTIVVFAAAGGVGSVLVQLAVRAGIRVIGTAGAGQQERLRALGAAPIDYRAEDVVARVRQLAPDGVTAVVDNVGGPGIKDSWRLLRRGGALIALSDMTVIDAPHPLVPFLRLYLRLTMRNLLPNGKRAQFFDIWKGHRRLGRFQAALRTDLTELFGMLADGSLTAPVDSQYPLSRSAEALRRAEAGGLAGKVVIVPDVG
jgi:NADPH:quinone reductase-like Zn-dependent oxidoreductase